MAQAYQFTFIDAPIDTVWRVVFDDAEQHGSIIAMEEPRLLVVQSQDICSIYGLRQYPAMENKTGVYLVLTHDEAAAVDVVNAPDLFRALEAMSVDVAPDVYEGAKAHLENIKTLVTEAAKKPAVDGYKLKADGSKRSIDPYKSGPQPVPAEETPVVRFRLVWVVYIFFSISIYLNGIFAAASLLALNWWSMGKPRKAVSTLLTSITVWGLSAYVIQMVAGGINPNTASTLPTVLVSQFLIGLGVIYWQIKQQKPTYQQAVERYGKPSGWSCRNITIAVAVIIASGMLATSWFRTFNPIVPRGSAFISSPQTFTDDRITVNYPNHWSSVKDAQEICASQDDPQQPGRLKCWAFGAEEDRSALMFMRTKDYFGFLTTLDGLSQKDIESIETNPDPDYVRDLEHTTQVKFKIDGREAVKYQYQYTKKSANATIVGTVLYIRDNDDWVRLYIYTPPGRVETADAIVDSVHFVNPLPE